MRGLNEWLERDVYDRQSELRGVVARVDQLSHDIRGIRAQGKDISISIIWMRLICILEGTSSSGSGSDETSSVYQPGPSFPIPQPSLRYPPVIPPVVPETTGFQGPFIPPQTFPQPPPFPQPQSFPQPITVTTLPPRMPPFLPGPTPFGPGPDRRTSEGGSVFIPPDLSPASRHSTGEPRPTYPMSPPPIPRPYPTDLGEVLHVTPSPSSSSGTSTDTYRRDGSRRDSRRADSRVGEPRRESYESRPTSRSESRHPRTSSPRRSSRPGSGPLVVTNLSEVPEVVSDPYGRHSGPSQRHSMPQQPPVHIIPPSMSPESSHYQRSDSPQFQPHFQPQPQSQPPQQPAPTTITILPSPSQPPVVQSSPIPMGPSFHPPMSEAGMTQMPMTPIGMVPSGASMGMAPSGVPMVPMGGMMPSVMQPTPQVIMQPSSRSSSRSSGRRMAPSGMPMGMAPSVPMGMAPSGMPTVPTGGIMMQPTAPVIIQQPSRSSSRSSGVRMTPGMPMGMTPSGMPMGMAPSGMPMGMAPSGMPMVPTGGMMPSVMQPMIPPAVIMQPSSRSSSRSHRSHRRTPPASQPLIINTDQQRRTPPHVIQAPPPPQPQPQPQVVVMSDRHSPSRRTESPSRRHSRHGSPPIIMHQPAPYPAPMGIPPPGMLPMGMGPGMMGTAPMVIAGSPRSSRSRSRSPRRDAPYIVPVQQPTGRTWSRHRYDDDYDSRSPPRRHRPRPHRDSSRSSYDRRRHDGSRYSPRRRHSRSPSYGSRSPPRLHYPPATGVGPSGVVPILPTHYPTQHPTHFPSQQYPSQQPSHYPGYYPSHYPSRLRRSQSSSPSPSHPPRAGATYEHPYSHYPTRLRRSQSSSPPPGHPPRAGAAYEHPYSHYPSHLRRSQSSSPSPGYPPRAGTTYGHPYSSSRDRRTGDGSPSRYESRRPQTTSPSPWHPPPVDPSRGRPYSPSRRHHAERRTSDGSLVPVPYGFRRPESSSFSPERPPRGEVIRGQRYSPSRRRRGERPGSIDGSLVSVPYESRRPQSTISSERLPRVEVIRGRPPRHHRAGRYYTDDGSPGRYDPRDTYDPRGRPSERDWRRARTPRYDRGRRYSSEYRRPKQRDPYPPSRRYHSVSSERRSLDDSRRGRDSPSGTQFPRDMSVSTGRSPTPVPRRESGPPVSSAIRREGPTDMTPPPTHRPLESAEHEPVIIKVPSRAEAALRRPPSSMLDEEIPAHTPAVTHVGK